ncbi:MAG: YIP1 family protein [Lachnospiraceae bacterium]|nr:YIP1 family protein [Lachnospiraceae bacterium]MCM1231976.1 YIP1 family protein [Ruminococcus flavefaciens]
MKDGFYASMPKWKYPFYILRHPVDGYHELKNNKKFSMSAANLILFAWVLLTILNWGYIDFDFRTKFTDVSLLQVFLTTIVIFAMVVVANWCFCTLMDGKGRMPEIWICCAYALLPYVICGYVRFILSFVIVYDEAVFLTYLTAIAMLWSFLLFLLGLSILHDYSLSKLMASFGLTVLGVFVMIFFAVLISGLVTQICSFVMTVYSEIRYRML